MINNKFKRQALMWLIMAAVMLVLWLLLSLANKMPAITKEGGNAQVTAENLSLPSSIDNLNELSKEVPPIDFEIMIRDLRNYPAEFKGKKFFQDNEKYWTVQVMEEVEKNDVITAYLEGRNDRDKFAYFRYHNNNNEQRYILTYDIMGTREEALGAIKVVDFALPKSMDNPVAVEIKKYVNIMDNYERAETVIDESKSTQRNIVLEKTTHETPAEPLKKESPKEESKPKVADEGRAVNANKTDNDPPNQTKLNMPPTAIPVDTTNEPFNDRNLKTSRDQGHSDSKSEQDFESKNDKPTKNEPKATQAVSVEDLPPAPPMPNTNTPSIPSDD